MWAAVVEELQDKVAAIRKDMSCRRNTVLREKKLALFEKLIPEPGRQDLALVEDLAKRLDLAGILPRSEVFQNHFGPLKSPVKMPEP